MKIVLNDPHWPISAIWSAINVFFSLVLVCVTFHAIVESDPRHVKIAIECFKSETPSFYKRIKFFTCYFFPHAANMPLTKHLRVGIIDSNPALKSRNYLKKDGVPDSRVSTITPATISFFRGTILIEHVLILSVRVQNFLCTCTWN